MIGVVPIHVTDAMFTSSSVAEPDTTIGETAWSSTEICVVSMERAVGAPSSTVTMTIASPCVITYTASPGAVDTEVVFSNSGGALPTGITAGETYYVAARLSVDTFTIKDADGRVVNTTGSQSGTHTATFRIHKVYRALIGGSMTVPTVDTGDNRFEFSSAHNIADAQPFVLQTTGAMPNPLTANTIYYAANTSGSVNLYVTANSDGSSSGITLTTTGSGTLTLGYGNQNDAAVAPNFNKHPTINPTYWEEVGATNKWAVVDDQVSVTTEGANPYFTFVPGQAWDTVAILRHSGASTIAVLFEISRATGTFDAGTDKFSWTSNGLADGDPIAFSTTGTLPPELSPRTVYYAKSPGTNDTQIAATVGGAAINLSGTGSGTHTAGKVAFSQSLDVTRRLPYATEIVSEANQAVAAYQNGTITISFTGAAVEVGEIIIGLGLDLGTTADEMEAGIRNYSVITRDDFANVSVTRRGYIKKLSADVLVEGATLIDEVADWLADHKDDFVLLIGTDALEINNVYGLIVDWNMASNSDAWKRLRLQAEGLSAT